MDRPARPGDPTEEVVMRQFGRRPTALTLAAAFAFAATATARAGETVERPGTGAAYAELGKVAVMHEGRVKPLDTVAREEIKQVYGRETLVLRDPREAVESILDPAAAGKAGTSWKVEKWGHLGAFLGWTVRPEYWDDQPFILVEYFPLRRLILSGTIRSRLDGIAAKETTPAADKERLRALAVDPELNAPTLIHYVRAAKLPEQDRRTVAELAARLAEDHKWLSPRELQEAVISVADSDGHAIATPFLNWASAANDKKQRFDRNPNGNARPTEVERRAIDVASRLVTYQSYSGDRLSTAGIILIMPRPSEATYLAFTAPSCATPGRARRPRNP